MCSFFPIGRSRPPNFSTTPSISSGSVRIPELRKCFNEYFLFKTYISLLSYSTNRACWRVVSLAKSSKWFRASPTKKMEGKKRKFKN